MQPLQPQDAARTLFVTGTDTGVGKTRTVCALLHAARGQGLDACGYKPVASGCAKTASGLRNDDALALQALSAGDETYEAINPYAFEPAIAPHLAARAVQRPVIIEVLDAAHAQLAARHERIVVEGAGGWHVPLNDETCFSDWVATRQWPVLLVVGLRLGCLSHALLSAEAILRQTALVGWVANVLPPAQAYWQDNVEDLRRRLPAPLWGVIGEHASDVTAARTLAAGGYRHWLRSA